MRRQVEQRRKANQFRVDLASIVMEANGNTDAVETLDSHELQLEDLEAGLAELEEGTQLDESRELKFDPSDKPSRHQEDLLNDTNQQTFSGVGIPQADEVNDSFKAQQVKVNKPMLGVKPRKLNIVKAKAPAPNVPCVEDCPSSALATLSDACDQADGNIEDVQQGGGDEKKDDVAAELAKTKATASVAIAKKKSLGSLTSKQPAPCNASEPNTLANANTVKPAAAKAVKPAERKDNKKAAPQTAGEKTKANDKGEKRPRAMSAYFLFSNDKRNDIKAAEPELKMGEVSKKLGEMWKGMSDEEKRPYEDRAAADKEAVKDKQAVWDAAHPKDAAADNDDGDDIPHAKKQKKKLVVAIPGNDAATTGPVVKKAKKKSAAATKAPVPKPTTAYAIFCRDRLPGLAAENPECSRVELGALAEQEWRSMSDVEKEPFLQRLAASNAQQDQQVGMGADMELDAGVSGDHAQASLSDGDMTVVYKVRAERPKATKSKRGKKGSGGRHAKSNSGQAGEHDGGDVAAMDEDNDQECQDDDITEEPEAILCHDHRGKYWVMMKGSLNFYDFKFVDAKKVKQLRNRSEDAAETEGDDGFNGWGSRLLQLSDEYEAFRRQFDTDARECMDTHGGLNFDLMQPGSLTDACAVLGTMRQPDVGGLLAGKPHKKLAAVKGFPDAMINVPAMMLSLVTQRMIGLWRDRALKAEKQLSESGCGSPAMEVADV